MNLFPALGLILSLLLVTPLAAEAVIYKYVDETGRMHFVDDADKVPMRYRDQVDAIAEEQDTMSTEEYQAREEERAQRIIDRQEEQRAREAARQEEQRRAYQTPAMIRGNRVTIPVEVALGPRVAHLVMLIDTGASATVLHRQALANLQLPQGEKVIARIADGRTVDSEKIKFRYIEIGPFRQDSVHAMVIEPQGPPLPFDGMLGMDFLSAHPHRIDYENERILWEFQE